MATRSRTSEFITCRERMRGNKRRGALEMKDFKGGRPLLKPTHATDDDASSCENACSITVPPVWMEAVDSLKHDIAKIENKLQELSQDHGRHLLPGFGAEDDKEEKIQRVTSEITRLFRHCEQSMKQLLAQNDKPGHSPNSGDDVVRKNILATTATQLQELHFQFRRQQKHYLNSLKGQKAADEVTLDTGDLSAASITKEAELLLDPRFDSHQMQLLEASERHIAERNAAVEQIMSSVVELNEIFKEVHVLVIDQGTILDRIDYNIEQGTTKIRAAVKELESAEKHQKNSKIMLCIYLLLVLCCAMAVVLVIKKSLQSNRHG